MDFTMKHLIAYSRAPDDSFVKSVWYIIRKHYATQAFIHRGACNYAFSLCITQVNKQLKAFKVQQRLRKMLKADIHSLLLLISCFAISPVLEREINTILVHPWLQILPCAIDSYSPVPEPPFCWKYHGLWPSPQTPFLDLVMCYVPVHTVSQQIGLALWIGLPNGHLILRQKKVVL